MNRRTFATGLLALPFARHVVAAPEKKLRAVLIGVEHYPGLGTLPFCADDVKLLGPQLTELGYDYNSLAVDSTLGGVQVQAARDALQAAAANCGKEDRLLVYFSGHGGTIGGRQYLFFSDSDLSGGPVNGLPLTGQDDSLEAILRPCDASERILILDTCRVPVKGKGNGKPTPLVPVDKSFAKGAGAALRAGPDGRNIRQAVMYASQRGEVAVPAEAGDRSFYTGVLLDALKAGHRQVKDLQAYLRLNTPVHRPQPDWEGDDQLWIAPEGGGDHCSVVYLNSLRLGRRAPGFPPRTDLPCKMGGRSYSRSMSLAIVEGREAAAFFYIPAGAVAFEATWGVRDDYRGDRTGIASFVGITRTGANRALGITGAQRQGSTPERVRFEVRDAHQFCIRTQGAFDAPGDFFLGDPRFICR